MKTNKIASIVILTLLFVGACKQTPIEPVTVTPPPGPDPDPGSAVLTKFVAVGDSYVAGMQGGALFDAGQSTSIPKILATQFALAGGGTFNQPDINSVNGFNPTFSVVPTVIVGRLVLFDADGSLDPDGAGCQVSRSAAPRPTNSPASTSTCPSTVATPVMPAPYNSAQSPLDPSFLFAGDKLTLNNFGVPGARIFHAGINNYGQLNPLYGRFATDPLNVPLIADAASKLGTFHLFNFGAFDILNYATTGGVASNNGTGTNDMTDIGTFTAAYNGTIGAILLNPTTQVVLVNIPDFTTLPFFTTVLYNQIEFKSTNCSDAATIAGLNGLFAGYNAALDGLLAGSYPGLTADEVARRKVVYKYGKNPVLISDETLTDLGAALNGISPALAQFGKTRPATSTDVITLSAGGALGTCAPGPPTGVPAAQWIYGVSAPLPDQFVLIPSETSDILARTALFNGVINDVATANSTRVVVADINTAYKNLLASKVYVSDGVTITPSFAPPAGAFSEDGIHPNSRGCAFTANVIIDAINAKFTAVIPKASLGAYSGTGLPVNGQ